MQTLSIYTCTWISYTQHILLSFMSYCFYHDHLEGSLSLFFFYLSAKYFFSIFPFTAITVYEPLSGNKRPQVVSNGNNSLKEVEFYNLWNVLESAVRQGNLLSAWRCPARMLACVSVRLIQAWIYGIEGGGWALIKQISLRFSFFSFQVYIKVEVN